MAADLTTYDKILKEDYAPAIEKQFTTRTPLLNIIKRDSTMIEGREFVVPTQGRMTYRMAGQMLPERLERTITPILLEVLMVADTFKLKTQP